MDKRCSKCHHKKPIADFYLDNSTGRHKGACKDCVRAAARTYRKKAQPLHRPVAVKPAGAGGLLVAGTPKKVASRIADIAAHRSVLVFKAGKSYRVINASLMVGIYDAGCDYRDVLREIA